MRACFDSSYQKMGGTLFILILRSFLYAQPQSLLCLRFLLSFVFVVWLEEEERVVGGLESDRAGRRREDVHQVCGCDALGIENRVLLDFSIRSGVHCNEMASLLHPYLVVLLTQGV